MRAVQNQIANLPAAKAQRKKTFLSVPEFPAEHLQEALDLLARDRIKLASLDGYGRLSGLVQIGNKAAPGLPVAIELKDDGTFSCVSADQHRLSLALALKFNHMLISQRQRKILRAFLSKQSSIPTWVGDDYRISAVIGASSTPSPLDVRDIRDLQAYWTLLDLVIAAKPPIQAELVVLHVLKLYAQAPWAMQRAALDAVLRRLASVKAEGLAVSAAPVAKQVLGLYRVKRKGGERPYGVFLASAAGIDTSCSCPDFANNGLRFCKHAAAVLIYWQSQAGRNARFTKVQGLRRARLAWMPAVDLETPSDPLYGLKIHLPLAKSASGSRSELPPKWRILFAPSSAPDSSVQTVRPPPPVSDPSGRLAYLKRLVLLIERPEFALVIEPAVMPLLQRELDKACWPAQSPSHAKKFAATRAKMHQKLYPYQHEGVAKALAQGRFLLGDDMGLGKTTQAIAWAECLLKERLVKRLIVICPNALKSQWREEWRRVSGREVVVVAGSADERHLTYRGKAPVLLVNYELCLRDMDDLLLMNADAVILDEAQRVKNYASQTSQQIKRLRPNFRLILTGTPMENRVQEFVSLMDWINPGAFGPSWRLDVDFSFGDGRNDDGPRGVRGLSRVRDIAAPYFLRRRRDQVLPQLPSRTDSVLPVEISEDQKAIHDELGTKAVRLMRIAESRPLTPQEHLRLMSYLTRMRIVSNGLAQYEFPEVWPTLQNIAQPERRFDRLRSPKLAAFRALIENLLTQPGVKMVIFSQWQRMLKLCHWAVSDLLRNAGVEAVFFTGGQDLRRRTENIARFHDDPKVRLFFATDAGGVGLNLQRAANACINLELPWNPAVLEQRIGRVHRLGQDRAVQVFNLVSQGCIEERIATLVGHKRAVFAALFDGEDDTVVFEKGGGFYSQVRQVMEEFSNDSGDADRSDDADEPLEGLAIEDAVSGDEAFGQAEDTTAIPPSGAAAMADLDREKALGMAMPGPVLTPALLAEAFAGLHVQSTEAGGLRIEAERAQAELLAEVFGAMAAMFRSARGRPGQSEVTQGAVIN